MKGDKDTKERHESRQKGVALSRERSDGSLQQTKERCGDMFKKMEECSFTIFFDNLLTSMTKSWLYPICKFEGNVVDIYISRKVRETSS